MARTIRYASPARAKATGPTIQSQRDPSGSKELDVDGYLERLAKYVPAEILTGFTPLAALTADRPAQLTFVTIVFLVLTPLYLFATRVIQPIDSKSTFRSYMYILAPISFVVWALNTSEPFRKLIDAWPPVAARGGIDVTTASLLLVLGALIIPLADILLDYWSARREGRPT